MVVLVSVLPKNWRRINRKSLKKVASGFGLSVLIPLATAAILKRQPFASEIRAGISA
jgi:hypothetical protein